MAKNLKLNIKNAQLAEALKLTQVKKAPKEKERKKGTAEALEAAPAAAEEPSAKIQEAPLKEAAPEPHVPPKEEAPAEEAETKEVFEKKFEEPKAHAPQASRPPMQPHYERSHYERREPRFEQRPHFQQRQGPRPGGYQPRPPGQGYQQRPGFGERRPSDFRSPQARPPQGGPPYNRGPQPHRPYPPRGPMPPREPPSQRPLPPKAPAPSFETRKTGPKEYRDVKPLKKAQERTFDSRDRQGLTDVENEAWRKRRPSHKHKQIIQEEVLRPKVLSVRLPITVKDLASEMKLKASQLISKLFMKGIVITLNDFLDDETTVQLLGQDFDCEIRIDTSEEERIRITDKTIKQEIQETDPDLLKIRAPVVAFMGHVDHGKTSLIDSIRKSNRVSMEAGAITQHIGAFRCHTAVGDITVLDTPGHEAFSSMRERGADVTDIIVLVIAGDEGLKTQTLEAIEQAKSAKVPIVVAINKSDKPGFNAENVYRQLSEHELLPEKWGGSVITINCSALTGVGVNELLEMLALQAEVLELRANPDTRARGAVIESEMHKGLGSQATVLVQNGSLRQGDPIVFDQHWGRVKTMHDENGKEIKIAGPSTPVKITGLSGLPEAGSEFIIVKTEKEARELGEARTLGHKNLALQQAKKVGVEGLLQKKAETLQKKILNLILRADVQGSLEALKSSLQKIESKKVELNVISSEVGEISESDIQLAAASKATIVGFHTKIESHAESLIRELKVTVRLHDIIYHAVDDVKEIMVGLLDKIAEEVDTGAAEVKATFKASQLGVIAGCIVTQGTIRRNQHIRLLRGGEQIWKGPIASLKRVKEDVREVSKGVECGILLQNFNNLKEGDIIQAFDINYLTQEL